VEIKNFFSVTDCGPIAELAFKTVEGMQLETFGPSNKVFVMLIKSSVVSF